MLACCAVSLCRQPPMPLQQHVVQPHVPGCGCRLAYPSRPHSLVSELLQTPSADPTQSCTNTAENTQDCPSLKIATYLFRRSMYPACSDSNPLVGASSSSLSLRARAGSFHRRSPSNSASAIPPWLVSAAVPNFSRAAIRRTPTAALAQALSLETGQVASSG